MITGRILCCWEYVSSNSLAHDISCLTHSDLRALLEISNTNKSVLSSDFLISLIDFEPFSKVNSSKIILSFPIVLINLSTKGRT